MNSTNNNSFEIAAKNVFLQLGQLIEEDEQLNNNHEDDKPKPISLLDLSTDILNIIGGYVKKDNKIRERDELIHGKQIINGREIIFPVFCPCEIHNSINTKEAVKKHIFDYINSELPNIKNIAKMYRISLCKDDKRKCAWVLFKDVNL